MKDRTPLIFRGLGYDRTTLTLLSLGLEPDLPMVYPRYSTWPFAKLHFVICKEKLTPLNLSMTSRIRSACYSMVREKISVPSIKMKHVDSPKPNSTLFISLVNVQGSPVVLITPEWLYDPCFMSVFFTDPCVIISAFHINNRKVLIPVQSVNEWECRSLDHRVQSAEGQEFLNVTIKKGKLILS